MGFSVCFYYTLQTPHHKNTPQTTPPTPTHTPTEFYDTPSYILSPCSVAAPTQEFQARFQVFKGFDYRNLFKLVFEILATHDSNLCPESFRTSKKMVFFFSGRRLAIKSDSKISSDLYQNSQTNTLNNIRS